ncbi:MAG: hypothetical protein U5N55_13670 [Cypionkella sp.]|nr:hypothetical protein [Cypionkella sp.]
MSKRKAYAAKFAAALSLDKRGFVHVVLLYLAHIDPVVVAKLRIWPIVIFQPFINEKLKVLEVFDGFSHVGFVVTTFFQVILLMPMAVLFAVMHMREPAGEKIEYFFKTIQVQA